jgi:hypothetical protein
MATLSLMEFSRLPIASQLNNGCPERIAQQVADLESMTVCQQVEFTDISQSDPFNVGTKMVRVNTDTACVTAYGSDPDASDPNTSIPMQAGQTEYFDVNPGEMFAVMTV